jgi:hypothetical protein
MIKEAEITEQAVRAEVARILSGRTLRGKETLQRLLSYLAERTLDGSAEAMKEYTIGVEVFGKPEDYNPQEDASVRVQLGRLRQKLEEHYRAESHAAPVVIELPKRQFALQFHSQAVAAPTSDLTAAMESLVAADELPRPAPGRLRKVSWPSLLLGALTVAALWAGWSFWQTRVPGQTSANAAATAETLELNELWRPFLASNRPVTMAVTMRPFLRYERGVIWDWEVSELPRPERDARMAELRQRLNAQTLVPWEQTYTSFGEATGIFLLTRLFEGHHHDLQLKRSGTLAWEEIAERNIIFLGAGKSGVPFQKIPIERAFVELGDRIVNVHPQNGEPHAFITPRPAPPDYLQPEDYALISLVPGLHGKGEILAFGGVSSPGLWAAVQYMTEPRYARELVEKLKGGKGALPRHYQVVIHARFQSLVPVEISYVTHREL